MGPRKTTLRLQAHTWCAKDTDVQPVLLEEKSHRADLVRKNGWCLEYRPDDNTMGSTGKPLCG